MRKSKRFSILFLLLGCMLLLCQTSYTQSFGEVTKIIASDRGFNDEFGISTDIDGDYAIVGAYRHNQPQGSSSKSNAGAAYIYKKDEGGTDNWGELVKLRASDFDSDDRFGISVAINGDYAAVGAFNEDHDENGSFILGNAGSVYIFKRNEGGTDNWGQIKKIVASDRAANDRFGNSIALSGGYLIVGADSEDENATGGSTMNGAGSAYVFKRNQGGTDNWGQIRKIVASDRAASDRFGVSVAISGDYALVGADKEDENTTGGSTLSDAGSAYVFKRNQGGTDNWGQIRKIVASDRVAGDAFGSSVAIDSDYAVVGAKNHDFDAAGGASLSNAGAAYMFKRTQGGTDNWGQIRKLVADDRSAADLFGYSVSISGELALIGAYEDNEDENGINPLSDAGSAYLLKQNEGGSDNWGTIQKLDASDREAGDHLSRSLAINGNHAIIGANLEDHDLSGGDAIFSAGAAYIYKQAAVSIAAKVFLQGPYNGTTMNTDMTSLLPIKEPYTTLGYVGLQNAGATSNSLTFAIYNIVDWVVLELRDASYTTVAARAALLQADGDVVEIDGVSPITFDGVNSGTYHIVVQHRNHLGIMTAVPIGL